MVGILASGTSCPGFDSQWHCNIFQRNNCQCCRGSSTTTTNSFASSSNELDVGVTGFLLVSCHDLNLDFFLPETIFLLKTVFFFFLNNFLDLSQSAWLHKIFQQTLVIIQTGGISETFLSYFVHKNSQSDTFPFFSRKREKEGEKE